MEAADAGFSRTTAVIFDRDDVNRVATPIGRYPEVGACEAPIALAEMFTEGPIAW